MAHICQSTAHLSCIMKYHTTLLTLQLISQAAQVVTDTDVSKTFNLITPGKPAPVLEKVKTKIFTAVVNAPTETVAGYKTALAAFAAKLEEVNELDVLDTYKNCLLYTSPSPRDRG